MKDKILDIAKNCLETNDSLKSICNEIKFVVSLKFLGIWYCFAFYNNFKSDDLFKNKVFTVIIKFGKLSIIVFKVNDKVFILKSNFSLEFILFFFKFHLFLMFLNFNNSLLKKKD
jgi:hypothetical protein